MGEETERNEGRKLKMKNLKEESEERKKLQQEKKHIEWECWGGGLDNYTPLH